MPTITRKALIQLIESSGLESPDPQIRRVARVELPAVMTVDPSRLPTAEEIVATLGVRPAGIPSSYAPVYREMRANRFMELIESREIAILRPWAFWYRNGNPRDFLLKRMWDFANAYMDSLAPDYIPPGGDPAMYARTRAVFAYRGASDTAFLAHGDVMVEIWLDPRRCLVANYDIASDVKMDVGDLAIGERQRESGKHAQLLEHGARRYWETSSILRDQMKRVARPVSYPEVILQEPALKNAVVTKAWRLHKLGSVERFRCGFAPEEVADSWNMAGDWLDMTIPQSAIFRGTVGNGLMYGMSKILSNGIEYMIGRETGVYGDIGSFATVALGMERLAAWATGTPFSWTRSIGNIAGGFLPALPNFMAADMVWQELGVDTTDPFGSAPVITTGVPLDMLGQSMSRAVAENAARNAFLSEAAGEVAIWGGRLATAGTWAARALARVAPGALVYATVETAASIGTDMYRGVKRFGWDYMNAPGRTWCDPRPTWLGGDPECTLGSTAEAITEGAKTAVVSTAKAIADKAENAYDWATDLIGYEFDF